jgi:hypothetical protein
MIKLVILLFMIYFHIKDDFYDQGILRNIKCRNWWEENYPDKLYSKDYIIALLVHGFSWTFSVHIPIFVLIFLYNYTMYGKVGISLTAFIAIFVVNALFHATIDDLKANELKINLIADQILHLLQILLIWSIYMFGGVISI